MAQVIFKRFKTDSEALSKEISDGNLIITAEGSIYTDYEDKRIKLSGSSDIDIRVVTDINSTEENDVPNCQTVKNAINGIIAWTNPDSESTFTSQTITLSESISEYTYYETLYKGWKGNPQMLTTGKIPVSFGSILQYYESSSVIGMRSINPPSDKSITIGNVAGVGVNNNYIVPYQVKLYKN